MTQIRYRLTHWRRQGNPFQYHLQLSYTEFPIQSKNLRVFGYPFQDFLNALHLQLELDPIYWGERYTFDEIHGQFSPTDCILQFSEHDPKNNARLKQVLKRSNGGFLTFYLEAL